MSGPSSVEANVEFGVPMTVVAETKRDGRERQLFGGQRERQVSGTAIEHSRTRCRPEGAVRYGGLADLKADTRAPSD